MTSPILNSSLHCCWCLPPPCSCCGPADSARPALARLGDPSLIQRLSATVNERGRRWQAALGLFALAMLLIAIARPHRGGEIEQIDQQGLQVMVALDVSQSMLAQDIQPSRLDRAKLGIPIWPCK